MLLIIIIIITYYYYYYYYHIPDSQIPGMLFQLIPGFSLTLPLPQHKNQSLNPPNSRIFYQESPKTASFPKFFLGWGLLAPRPFPKTIPRWRIPIFSLKDEVLGSILSVWRGNPREFGKEIPPHPCHGIIRDGLRFFWDFRMEFRRWEGIYGSCGGFHPCFPPHIPTPGNSKCP